MSLMQMGYFCCGLCLLRTARGSSVRDDANRLYAGVKRNTRAVDPMRMRRCCLSWFKNQHSVFAGAWMTTGTVGVGAGPSEGADELPVESESIARRSRGTYLSRLSVTDSDKQVHRQSIYTGRFWGPGSYREVGACHKGAIASKIKHAIKLKTLLQLQQATAIKHKTSHARLAQLLHNCCSPH